MTEAKEYQQVLLSPIPLNQLEELLAKIVRQEVRAKVEEELSNKLLSPKETCRLFHPSISLVTLASWTDKGFLNKRHIGGRTFYLQSEVLEAAKSLKKYNRV